MQLDGVLATFKQLQDPVELENKLLVILQKEALTFDHQSRLVRQQSDREVAISYTLYEMGFHPDKNQDTQEISVGRKLVFVKTDKPDKKNPQKVWKIVEDENHVENAASPRSYQPDVKVNTIFRTKRPAVLKPTLKEST